MAGYTPAALFTAQGSASSNADGRQPGKKQKCAETTA